MFERPHHQRIEQALLALDSGLLLKHRCLFGGGTAIALARGEYRESVDIDLVCSSVEGYREIRSLVNTAGIRALMAGAVAVLREPRIDQYGIRCVLQIAGAPIKFEIIFEGRVQLADPLPEDKVCGIWTLAKQDKVATKLMANSDRWADSSVMSRDLVDLAMLAEPDGALDPVGVGKAVHAYGPGVLDDVKKAKAQLLERKGRLAECMKNLGMRLPEAELRLLIQAINPQSAQAH
jgi:Nucleotidyl transferase AbiEii toxin, Type IV TA system